MTRARRPAGSPAPLRPRPVGGAQSEQEAIVVGPLAFTGRGFPQSNHLCFRLARLRARSSKEDPEWSPKAVLRPPWWRRARDRTGPAGRPAQIGGERLCDIIFGLGLASACSANRRMVLWVSGPPDLGGPGFYSQVRVGRGGCHYRIHKLRTMRQTCEAQTGARWATKGDTRVTPLSRVLRKLHLDELPQLWNVLRGDMSLVGPRPERPEFVVLLAAQVEGYRDRLRVRPGVTGLAQIQLPADSDIESVRTKLVLDRHYLEHAGLGLDLRIMLGTVAYLVGFSYTRVRQLTKLPNPLIHPRATDETQSHCALGTVVIVLSPNPAPTDVRVIGPAVAPDHR